LINGAIIAIYAKNPEADRAFFRNALKFSSVNASPGDQPAAGRYSELIIPPELVGGSSRMDTK
jgi:hypothetical protein